MRRATPRGGFCYLDNIISIHALLAESDHYDNYNLHCVEISIHALLAESDEPTTRRHDQYNVFLSTLSLRRATRLKPRQTRTDTNFYPRSPCGERHNTSSLMKCQVKFLSTLSLRRATVSTRIDMDNNSDFYPRSPCGERPTSDKLFMPSHYFYPRSPCGERPYLTKYHFTVILFLSTLSLRRATKSLVFVTLNR